MADGPVIQRAAERAIRNRIGLRTRSRWLPSFGKADAVTPVVLMGYANPIEKMGRVNSRSAAQCRRVSMVFSWSTIRLKRRLEFSAALKAPAIDAIFLLAPTTTDERIAAVAQQASGYLYYVSLKGITGAAHLDVTASRRGYRRSGATPACRLAWALVFATLRMRSGCASRRRCSHRFTHHRGNRIRRQENARCDAVESFVASIRHRDRQSRKWSRPHKETSMSWIDKILPPRIKREEGAARKSVPEGLWTKCPGCEAVLYTAELQKTLFVCPKCAHHMRIGARARLDALLDAEGRYEIGQEILPIDALKFRDSASIRSACSRRSRTRAKPTR